MKWWNGIIYTQIKDSLLDIVAAKFSAKYGVPGIVSGSDWKGHNIG
jgi:hypothetical protein